MGERGIIKLNNKMLKSYISEITGTSLDALENGVTEVELTMFIERVLTYKQNLNKQYEQFLKRIKEIENDILESKALLNSSFQFLDTKPVESVKSNTVVQNFASSLETVKEQPIVEVKFEEAKEVVFYEEVKPEHETMEPAISPRPQLQAYVPTTEQEDVKPSFVLPQRLEQKEETKVQRIMQVAQEKPEIVPNAQPLESKPFVQKQNFQSSVSQQSNKGKPTAYLGINPNHSDNLNRGPVRYEQAQSRNAGQEDVKRFDSTQVNLFESYKEYGFSEEQLGYIQQAIAAEVDVHKLTDHDLNDSQMKEVLLGLKAGIDVTPYLSNQFSHEKMKLLRVASEKKVDIKPFAYPDLTLDELTFNVALSLYPHCNYSIQQFDSQQLKEIRAGILAEKAIDFSIYFNPAFNGSQMYQIRRGLGKGLDVSRYADPKLSSDEMNIKFHNMQFERY